MSTLYPNLLAEYRASGYSIDTLADQAGVTVELMNAILNKNEELTLAELRKLHRLFSSFGGRRYSFGYLVSPKQSIMNPNKNKTRYRVKLLRDAVSEVEKLVSAGVYIGPVETRELNRAHLIIDALTVSPQPVGYSFYWWTMHWMQLTADIHKPTNRRGLKAGAAA